MDPSVLDILSTMNFSFTNANFNLFDTDFSKDLKPHFEKLGILDTNTFINELSISKNLNKLNTFEFKKNKNQFQFTTFSKEEISNPNIEIQYHFYATKIGQILIASTKVGICYLAFETKEKPSLPYLKETYPKAKFTNETSKSHQFILEFIEGNENLNLTFHIKGTPFQIEVWNALLEIPKGSLTSYGAIAKKINKPKAFRAVGTAIGNNPISVLIPCHRVIQSNGKFGGYMWGLPTKFLLIAWEGLQNNNR